MRPPTIERWHQMLASPATDTPALLGELLAEDCVFTSPVVHTPQQGKAITEKYLLAAFSVLNNDQFHYVREWSTATSAVLEFNTVVDGISINGIDMVDWDDEGRITAFKVMVRPLKAINLLHQKMGAILSAG
jgi:hypothetical protein